jgi:hypothetical protein
MDELSDGYDGNGFNYIRDIAVNQEKYRKL